MATSHPPTHTGLPPRKEQKRTVSLNLKTPAKSCAEKNNGKHFLQASARKIGLWRDKKMGKTVRFCRGSRKVAEKRFLGAFAWKTGSFLRHWDWRRFFKRFWFQRNLCNLFLFLRLLFDRGLSMLQFLMLFVFEISSVFKKIEEISIKKFSWWILGKWWIFSGISLLSSVKSLLRHPLHPMV